MARKYLLISGLLDAPSFPEKKPAHRPVSLILPENPACQMSSPATSRGYQIIAPKNESEFNLYGI
jgi:hypothetical protein